MSIRSRGGRETWRRLLEWDRGQADAERLAGHLLRFERFTSIDPSHPLGGPDGLKDVLCQRDGKRWIGAAYFPRGQQLQKEIEKKVKHDLEGISKNGADGLAFVTNQELRLAEREALIALALPHEIEILHLERIASALDSPTFYGLRLDFLDIDMTKEEQISFIADRDAALEKMRLTIERLSQNLETPSKRGEATIPRIKPKTMNTGFYALGSPRQHECASCNGIFEVEQVGTGAYLLGPTVITCPYCGRTDRYSSRWG